MAKSTFIKEQNIDTSDMVTWGLLGIIAYLLWKEYQLTVDNTPVPLPVNYVSSSTVCN